MDERLKIKRFFAKDMRTALLQVKEELGAEAVIMSNKKVAGGVEIVAAIDGESSPSTPSPSTRSLLIVAQLSLVIANNVNCRHPQQSVPLKIAV